jgi:phage tail tube protein FII
MAGWIDLKGPIVADTVYSDGQLVAKDATVALPAISPITADFKAMGTMSLPVLGQIESMEATITKVGVDLGLGQLVRLQAMNLELRWVQDTIQADGITKPEGCKAFLRVVPKTIPGLSVEAGAHSENDVTFEALRYQLYVGGTELWLVDRLAQILKILGVDYYKNIGSLL